MNPQWRFSESPKALQTISLRAASKSILVLFRGTLKIHEQFVMIKINELPINFPSIIKGGVCVMNVNYQVKMVKKV